MLPLSAYKVCVYLEDLSINIQHIDGDFYIPCYALPAFLKLSFLQCDVEVISHLSCRKQPGKRRQQGIDYAYELTLLMTSQQFFFQSNSSWQGWTAFIL